MCARPFRKRHRHKWIPFFGLIETRNGYKPKKTMQKRCAHGLCTGLPCLGPLCPFVLSTFNTQHFDISLTCDYAELPPDVGSAVAVLMAAHVGFRGPAVDTLSDGPKTEGLGV